MTDRVVLDLIKQAVEDATNHVAWTEEEVAEDIISILDHAGYVIDRDWQPIETAPQDGTEVLVYASGKEYDLPNYVGPCSFHEDAGWCVCELREPKYWRPLQLPEE